MIKALFRMVENQTMEDVHLFPTNFPPETRDESLCDRHRCLVIPIKHVPHR